MDGKFFKIKYNTREGTLETENSTHLKSTDEHFQGLLLFIIIFIIIFFFFFVCCSSCFCF